jgi:hypothetical protein
MFVRDTGGVLLHGALTMALSVVETIDRTMYPPIVKDILQSVRAVGDDGTTRPHSSPQLFACMFDTG